MKLNRTKVSLFFIMIVLLVGCKETTSDAVTAVDSEMDKITTEASSNEQIASEDISSCKEEESLLFEGESFASYTENTMRGDGVVSFTMDLNDRLTILNEDETNFGEIVLNEDMTYFTLTMPKKVVARKLVTNYDFAAFDFDADNIASDKDYIFVYVNKKKKKIRKADLKFTFLTWNNYIKNHLLKLKTCNLLKDSKGKNNQNSTDLIFKVTAINNDEIQIKSTKDCGEENTPFHNIEETLKWKSGNVLLIDFAVCN